MTRAVLAALLYPLRYALYLHDLKTVVPTNNRRKHGNSHG